MSKSNNSKVVRYNKWGYIFLVPFIVVYLIFQLVPLCSTIYYSFFTKYFDFQIFGYVQEFVGLDNYKELLSDPFVWKYLKNTFILWIIGFIPQILVSLLLGAWFSDNRLKLKLDGAYKVIIYLPNLIMASAFSMLFFTLFSKTGPINDILLSLGVVDKAIDFWSNIGWTRSLIGLMNFLMWFGNTTILLMAGMMGIDSSLFEAAEVDGATSNQRFFRITLPLLKPILIYVVITSLIGGLQMFDVPQILTNGSGQPAGSTTTLIMYLNKYLYSKDYGHAGAISVLLFFVTGILSIMVFKFSGNDKKVK